MRTQCEVTDETEAGHKEKRTNSALEEIVVGVWRVGKN